MSRSCIVRASANLESVGVHNDIAAPTVLRNAQTAVGQHSDAGRGRKVGLKDFEQAALRSDNDLHSKKEAMRLPIEACAPNSIACDGAVVTSEEFCAKARECEQRAGQARNAWVEQELLDLAQQWRLIVIMKG